MISLACGKLTGMAGCCGSNCSPMSMREELPREITKEAKVTGTPLADSAPAAGLDDASFEAAWDWEEVGAG